MNSPKQQRPIGSHVQAKQVARFEIEHNAREMTGYSFIAVTSSS